MRTSFLIMVDAREKRPLPFHPRYTVLNRDHPPDSRCETVVEVSTKVINLDHADYYLAGEPGVVYTSSLSAHRAIIERKASIDEIAQNVLNKIRRPRFIDSLKKMRDRWMQPLLLVEGGLSTLFTPSRNCPNPHLAADALLDLSLEYGVPLVPMPSTSSLASRYTLGEFVFRYLLSGSVAHPTTETLSWQASKSSTPATPPPTSRETATSQDGASAPA